LEGHGSPPQPPLVAPFVKIAESNHRRRRAPFIRPSEMLKNAVLAFSGSQSENTISTLLHFSTAWAVEK
jgi:hypothetical protein